MDVFVLLHVIYFQNDKRKMESQIRLLETTNKGLFEEIRQIRSSYDAKMEKLMKDFHIEIYKVIICGSSVVSFSNHVCLY